MTPRLGDDQSRGWLLLGGMGQALVTGGAVAATDAGGQYGPGMGHASALAQQLAAGGGTIGGQTGGRGGMDGSGQRRSLP